MLMVQSLVNRNDKVDVVVVSQDKAVSNRDKDNGEAKANKDRRVNREVRDSSRVNREVNSQNNREVSSQNNREVSSKDKKANRKGNKEVSSKANREVNSKGSRDNRVGSHRAKTKARALLKLFRAIWARQ